MKPSRFLLVSLAGLLVALALCALLLTRTDDAVQDTVRINECLHLVSENFGNEQAYPRGLDYAVLGRDGRLLYKTKPGVSENRTEAIKRGDTVLDLLPEDASPGVLIIESGMRENLAKSRRALALGAGLTCAAQFLFVLIYYLYLKRTVLNPFRRLNAFAARVAQGDLDIPLTLDKKHVFGSFTEAFDLMRSELKKARDAEKQANDAKKELVAKLSHDIKTPVASIKSASELGMELSADEKSRARFALINQKADQLTALSDNLFNSSVQELTQLSVNPLRESSDEVGRIISAADYLGKARAFTLPECGVYADRLRLQQTFDNLFANSYKYADTPIDVDARLEDGYLLVTLTDGGPGVEPEELPLLKGKYKRGKNALKRDGAGLGLYLADYFVSAMQGRLTIENACPGLRVKVYLRLV